MSDWITIAIACIVLALGLFSGALFALWRPRYDFHAASADGWRISDGRIVADPSGENGEVSSDDEAHRYVKFMASLGDRNAQAALRYVRVRGSAFLTFIGCAFVALAGLLLTWAFT